jgi:hypothetical protein
MNRIRALQVGLDINKEGERNDGKNRNRIDYYYLSVARIDYYYLSVNRIDYYCLSVSK